MSTVTVALVAEELQSPAPHLIVITGARASIAVTASAEVDTELPAVSLTEPETLTEGVASVAKAEESVSKTTSPALPEASLPNAAADTVAPDTVKSPAEIVAASRGALLGEAAPPRSNPILNEVVAVVSASKLLVSALSVLYQLYKQMEKQELLFLFLNHLQHHRLKQLQYYLQHQ